MDTDVIILAGIAASVIALITVKTHMSFAILALCAGFVLSEVASESVFNFLSQWIDPLQFPLLSVILITLLILPALLIGHRFRRTQHGIGRVIQQIVPALALSLLTVVLILDRLPSDVVKSVSETSYLVSNLQSLSIVLVLFAIAVALFDVLARHSHDGHRRGKKHKRGPGRPPKH